MRVYKSITQNAHMTYNVNYNPIFNGVYILEEVLFYIPFSTNKTILISTSQTFRSWIEISMAFLSPILYARVCSLYECFILRDRLLSSRLLKQGYLVQRLKSLFRKFYGR